MIAKKATPLRLFDGPVYSSVNLPVAKYGMLYVHVRVTFCLFCRLQIARNDVVFFVIMQTPPAV